MRKYLFLLLCLIASVASAQEFDKYFEDATLRVDYIMAGNDHEQHIYLQQLCRQERWAGRKSRLAEQFLGGNGQLTVRDHATHEVLYVWTFSTLFQEWQQYDEARSVERAFETSYNLPYPKAKVDIEVTLTDSHNQITSRMQHTVDPADILIRHIGDNGIPYHYVWKGGAPAAPSVGVPRGDRNYTIRPYDPMEGVDVTRCIDIAIVAEGYTEAEMGKFYHDCQRAADALFTWEPFRSLRDRFNIVAVASPSLTSGPSVPHQQRWSHTAAGTHYDTFYTQRYLTTQQMHRVYDLLSGVPFEHVIILVNTNTYGGGGIYNQITIATSDHPTFREVLVHEFGHAFGGLADEYAYDDMDTVWYPADTEPWEPNITTLHDFAGKWADLLPAGCPIPTPIDPTVPDSRSADRNDAEAMAALNRSTQVVGVFEGAGYMTQGCYRPTQLCRMRVNEVEDFCPVCQRAIRNITDFYTSH